MNRINLGRVFIGGIVAGIVMNACDFLVNTYLMGDAMIATAQRLSLDQAKLESSAFTWIVVDLLWGILLVWTYAAMRPRFGPGPNTAIVSAGALFVGVTLIILGFTSMGIFTQDVFIKSTVLSLISTMLAALAGAKLYKE
jgi:magnesium-transporting ATPase (P-type)